MYRYNVNNAVTYTSEDLDLFRESPFAAWMERLTLENPDHGIFPDLNTVAPAERVRTPSSVVETLRAEGKQVVHVSPELDEPERREATVSAMHEGVDFIAGGQLAVGAFSGFSHLLMRTSGYTDLGDFLYIPCEEEMGDTFHSGFRLAFLANLLHSLQGQLPPQLLIIRDGSDVVPLQTEDHIHFFRSVLARFEQAMLTFRKHRMPDPSDSSHFGRWSACASEVLKQRMLNEQARTQEGLDAAEAAAEEGFEVPQLLFATGAAPGVTLSMDSAAEAIAGRSQSPRADAGPTLAEQARMLEPRRFRPGAGPGHTPNLANLPRVAVGRSAGAHSRSAAAEERDGQGTARMPMSPSSELSTDATLENLEFIRGRTRPVIGSGAALEDDGETALDLPLELAESVDPGAADSELDVPRFLPPEPEEGEAGHKDRKLPPTARRQPGYSAPSAVDLDSAPAPTLAPVRSTRQEPEDEEPPSRTYDIGIPAYRDDDDDGDADAPAPRPFEDRLNTSPDFDDD